MPVIVMLMALEHDFRIISNAYHWPECSRRMRNSLNGLRKSCSAEIAWDRYFVFVYKYSYIFISCEYGHWPRSIRSSSSTLRNSDRDIVFKLLGRSLCDYTRFWFIDYIFVDRRDCLFYNVYLIIYASPARNVIMHLTKSWLGSLRTLRFVDWHKVA